MRKLTAKERAIVAAMKAASNDYLKESKETKIETDADLVWQNRLAGVSLGMDMAARMVETLLTIEED